MADSVQYVYGKYFCQAQMYDERFFWVRRQDKGRMLKRKRLT